MTVCSLSDAARALGRTRGSLVWLLRTNPGLAGSLLRVGGKRVFTSADLERIAAAYAARSRRTTTPESQP